MGACPEEDPERRIKRSALLRTLASPQKLNQMKIEVAQFAEEYLKKSLSKELSLEELSLQLVLYIDSHLSGILELKNKPLNHYAETEKYALFMREYIEIAFKAVARKNKLACQQGELAIPFIKDIIKDNFNCIDSSSCDNIIKKIFEIYDMPWTKKAVGQVPVEVLKELSAIIVPLYETTSVSLYWLISYIESNPTIKEKVIIDSIQAIDLDRLSFIDLVVIETIRIAGANPFVVFRDVIKTCDIQIAEKTFRLEEGMQVCLDRRNSNQDQTIFRCPYEFNQDNIVSILQDDHETIHSLFAHKRYEINSFTAVNTFKNPRKCPGRFFSIFIQSCIIREIYSKYTTHVSDVSLDLRKHSLMPRPLAGAKIRIEKR